MLVVPNTPDRTHKYVFYSGEYGEYKSYWWIDYAGNYYKYSNAPLDHIDHDPTGGEPIMDPDQPFLHLAPQFYTPEGLKRNMAVPDGVKTLPNPKYNPQDIRQSWHEYYLAEAGELRYLYLDKDVKEIIDLYVQHNIRVVDAGLNRLRKFAAELFQSETNDRNKMIGCILQLTDQAWFRLESLINATVADIDFIDETVYLLGRKIKVDATIYDYLTSLVAGRDLASSLFYQTTLHGEELSWGMKTICATFAYLKVSPVFLQYWHSTHLFSKIINKHNVLGTPPDNIEAVTYTELANVLNTTNDIKYLVDPQVSNTLLRNYRGIEEAPVSKSFTIASSDSFGVAQVFSDLVERRGDELEFSRWLHSQPLHSAFEGDTSEDELDLKEQAVNNQEQENQDFPLLNDQDGDQETDNIINEQGQTEEDVPFMDRPLTND